MTNRDELPETDHGWTKTLALTVSIAVTAPFLLSPSTIARSLAPGAWGVTGAAALVLLISQATNNAVDRTLVRYLQRWGWMLAGTTILAVLAGHTGSPFWLSAMWFGPIAILCLVRTVNALAAAESTVAAALAEPAQGPANTTPGTPLGPHRRAQ